MAEISDAVFDAIYAHTQGMSFGGVWSYTEYSSDWVVPEAFAGFNGRKEFFFRCLRRFMDSNLLVLHKGGEVLKGSIEEQLNTFISSFPPSESEVDMGWDALWFHTEACPAEPAWVAKEEDGVEWLDFS